MRTACYLRYSSDVQREASIQDQLRNVENYCARMSWSKPIVFQDQAISGSRNDRPGYLLMLKAAFEGVFDILVVDDLSRLSRDHIECTQTIRRLKYLGIQVMGASDGTDTSRDGYKLETGLRGLMSEYYLDDLAKKTHRGLTGQAMAGYSAGGLPYGYTSLNDGKGFKRVINEDQAKWIRYIFERYSNGISSRQIASELNEKFVPGPRGGTWSHGAIYPSAKMVGILCNSMYNGKQVWNKTLWLKDPITGKRKRTMRPKEEWITVDSPELQIIDDELWAKCQMRANGAKRDTAVKKTQGKGSGGVPAKYLFSGLLKCGVCGGSYIMLNRTSYGCATHKDRGDFVCSNKLVIKRSTVEQDLLSGIKKALLSEEAYLDFEKNLRASIKTGHAGSAPIKKKVADLQKGVDNLTKVIMDGVDSQALRTALQTQEQQLRDAQYELKAAERYQPTQLVPHAREMFEDLVTALENIEDVGAARQALRQLVGEIKLKPENGLLTAEVPSVGLSAALQIAAVAGAGFERYLPETRNFIALR